MPGCSIVILSPYAAMLMLFESIVQDPASTPLPARLPHLCGPKAPLLAPLDTHQYASSDLPTAGICNHTDTAEYGAFSRLRGPGLSCSCGKAAFEHKRLGL